MSEDSEDKEMVSSDVEDHADTDDELLEESTSRLVRPLEFLSRSTSSASGNVLSESARLEMMELPPMSQTPLSRHRSSTSSNEKRSFLRRKNNFSARELSDRDASRTVSNWSSMNEFMTAIAVMAKVPVKDRRYHFKVYKQCFIAKELVDLLMANECASTRKEATHLVRNINKHFEVLEHVVQDHEFKDEVCVGRVSMGIAWQGSGPNFRVLVSFSICFSGSHLSFRQCWTCSQIPLKIFPSHLLLLHQHRAER